MLKRFTEFWKKVWAVSAPITHARLMTLGFEYYHPFYIMGSISVESDIQTNRFYYIDKHGNQIRIKIMRDIAGLIFGTAEYGK